MRDVRPVNKKQLGDYRKPLNLNYDVVKPSAKTAMFAKEHIMTDYEIDKLYEQMVGPGPSTFKPSHKLTEKRDDVGIVKIQQPIVEEKQEADNRSALFPNLKAILPNHMTFKYYEPADVGPQHIPDKAKNPGRWRYYDLDLDSIRAQIFQNVYIAGGKNMDKDAFQEREEFLELLDAYLEKV